MAGRRHEAARRARPAGAGPGIGMQEQQPVAAGRRGAGGELRAAAARRATTRAPAAGRVARAIRAAAIGHDDLAAFPASAQAASTAPRLRAAFRVGMTMDSGFVPSFLNLCSHLVLDSAVAPGKVLTNRMGTPPCRMCLDLSFLPEAGRARAAARSRTPRCGSRARRGTPSTMAGDAGGLADLPPLPTTLLRNGEERAGLEREPGYRLRPLDQPLPRLRAWLRLLLCPAEPCLCRLFPGLDFETKLLFKPDLPALLEKELRRPGYVPRPWRSAPIPTPTSRRAGLLITRQVLEVLERFGHPVTIVTKSAGVLRDLDILTRMAGATWCMSACPSPRSSRCWRGGWSRAPPRRCGGCRRSGRWPRRGAGRRAGGADDPRAERRGAGAHFVRKLQGRRDPGRLCAAAPAARDPAVVRGMAAGACPRPRGARPGPGAGDAGRRAYDSRFGVRQTGTGAYADMLARRFQVAAARLGLAGTNARSQPLDCSQFAPPPVARAERRQLELL